MHEISGISQFTGGGCFIGAFVLLAICGALFGGVILLANAVK